MTSLSVETLAADAVEPITSAGNAQLGIAVVAGIAVIVLLITKFKLHAFLALTIGSLALGSFAGAPLEKTIASFTAGLGSTVAGVGVLIALGAILGKLLADSGGADQIVDTILAKASGRAMPWAMVLIASIIGLPLFFEVGIVLLIPVVLLVAKRGNYSLMRIGIPALAGLSVMHGLIPRTPVRSSRSTRSTPTSVSRWPSVWWSPFRPWSSPVRSSPGSPPAGWTSRRPSAWFPSARPRSWSTARASARRWPPCCCRSC